MRRSRNCSKFVDFLKNPESITCSARGYRARAALGPPAPARRCLRRPLLVESGVPFFSVSASEFVEMFVGVGAPACAILQ